MDCGHVTSSWDLGENPAKGDVDGKRSAMRGCLFCVSFEDLKSTQDVNNIELRYFIMLA